MGTRSTPGFGFALAFMAIPLLVYPSELHDLPKLNTSDFLPAINRQIEAVDSAARAHRQSANAAGNLGMVLDAYRQYSAAAKCYQRAHLLNPHSFRWAYLLGSAQIHRGEYDHAIVTLREALRLSPDYLPARLKLAESLLAIGALEESGVLYKATLRSEPDCAEAFHGKGRMEAAQGEVAAAAASYRRACDLFPNYGAAQYALALTHRKLGRPEEAQSDFRLYQANMTVTPPLDDPLLGAVQALNHSADEHLTRGAELERQGNIREAIAEHEQALAIDPNDVQAHINLISLYARAGQAQKAEQQFREAVRLNSNRADAYYNGGVLLFGEQKYAEAELAFGRAIAIDPNYAEAHNNLGFLLEQQGRKDDALAEFQAAVRDLPNYALAHFHLATILAGEGKYDEAIQHLLKTLSPEDENTPRFLYALGTAYGRQSDLDNALKYIRAAKEQATAWRQSQFLASIDRDLQTLEQETKPIHK